MSNYRKPKILFRPAQADENCIRVRLDDRTIVLIKSMRNFEFWKARYPEARLMDPVVGQTPIRIPSPNEPGGLMDP